MKSVEILRKLPRQILRYHNRLEQTFPFRYSFNPASGCDFSCFYCAAGQTATVKIWPDCTKISNELNLLPNRQLIGIGGGACDPFQPSILSSNLYERLLPLLKRKEMRPFFLTHQPSPWFLHSPHIAYSYLTISLTPYDSNDGGPSENEVIPLLSFLKDSSQRGAMSSVMISPVIPEKNDDVQVLAQIIKKSKENGAQWVSLRFFETSHMSRKGTLPEFLIHALPLIENKKGYHQYKKTKFEQFASILKEHSLLPFPDLESLQSFLSVKDRMMLYCLHQYYFNYVLKEHKVGYKIAAESLNETPDSKFALLVQEKALTKLRGVGPNIEKRLIDFLEGDFDFYRKMKDKSLGND